VKIHLPDLTEIAAVDPVVVLVSGAGIAGFLLALVVTWIVLALTRRRGRKAASAPLTVRVRVPQQLPPVSGVKAEPAMLLPPPSTVPPPVVPASRAHVSVLDFLPSAIEPYPPKPRMEFIQDAAQMAPKTHGMAWPVPTKPADGPPAADKSLGLPQQAWSQADVHRLKTGELVPAKPPRTLDLGLVAPPPPPPPRKVLGLIKLKPRSTNESENSATRYSRRAS